MAFRQQDLSMILSKSFKPVLDYSHRSLHLDTDIDGKRTKPLVTFKVQQIILEEKVAIKRWMYRGGHPNQLTKIINWGWAVFHSLGIAPNYLVTLEVMGRQSGKLISLPLAMTVMNGKRYLVSMLGEETNWVRNVRAAGGKARLRHGIREQVLLEEVDVSQRAPILKVYLRNAPGARPHIPVSKDAPISAFEKIAPKYPVFSVKTIQ